MYNVGKVVNTHGIKGEVRVISSTDFPEKRFKKGQTLFLTFSDKEEIIPLQVSSHREHKQFHIIKFKELNSINDVERFKGGVLKVSEEDREPLPEGEYYFQDIIGCKVFTTDGAYLGQVKEILTPGANDVWVVKPEKGKDILIPYIDDVVKNVDLERKVIKVYLIPGLI